MLTVHDRAWFGNLPGYLNPVMTNGAAIDAVRIS